MRSISLAVDGGQSSLRLRVVEDGRTGVGPGHRHSERSQDDLLDALRAAATDAAGSDSVDVVCLGLAGFPPDPAAARALARRIAETLPAAEVRLTQDMVIAHAGALPDGYGVVVAGGTGLVCLGIDAGGGWRKVDGHGYLFGDAGSAFAIGRAGLVAVQRARDGRGPDTVLAETSLDPVTLYPSPTLVADVARFAPVVLRAARAGDPVAHDIVVRAVADIAETIAAAVRGPMPVALVGGLFEGAGEQLVQPLREALPEGARLVAPAGNSLDGAARLARGDLGPYADLVVVHRGGQR